MNYKPLFNIVNTFHDKKVNHAVIAPGSRSAPLTISFARHDGIRKFIMGDERSAGYIALGICQALKSPVVLICTSGTAAYNFAPAVAEAYYQQLPLIILTADRPEEWIDQADGQSIYQENIYGKHTKGSYRVPSDLTHPDTQWHALRIVSEAVNNALTKPLGPVHINFPFREPLYPSLAEDQFIIEKEKTILRYNSITQPEDIAWKDLEETWNSVSRVLIVPGQGIPDHSLSKILCEVSEKFNIPVTCDIIANLHGSADSFIYKHDLFLNSIGEKEKSSLRPELLITFGKSILSKNLKLFLRKNKPLYHWHIQEAGYSPDTYQALTHIVPASPVDFFTHLISFKRDNISESYYSDWSNLENKTRQVIKYFFPQSQPGDLEAVSIVMENMPDSCNLHLSNSLPVRLANYIGLRKPGLQVYSNRGTSGIDGCSSTAVGTSLVTQNLNVLVSGDMAFFYDRNAFWHNYNLSNLRIILLNNHGGGIFRMIDGPENLKELKNYFETDQLLTAENTARDFGMEYFISSDLAKLPDLLKEFFRPSERVRLLEIETESETNRQIFLKLINEIKKS